MYHRRIQCRRNAFSSSSGSTPVFQETYCTWPLSFLLPPGKPHSILKCWLRVCCIFVCPKMAWLPMLGYTHAQMFMHAIARRSRTNTLGESAPKPNSGIKIHCVTGSQIWTTGQDTQPTETRLWEKNLLPHRESNLDHQTWTTLSQPSYIPTPYPGEGHTQVRWQPVRPSLGNLHSHSQTHRIFVWFHQAFPFSQFVAHHSEPCVPSSVHWSEHLLWHTCQQQRQLWLGDQ